MFGLDGEIKYEDKKKVIVFLNGSNHWADWIANFFFRGKNGIHSQWKKMVEEATWLHDIAGKAQGFNKQLILVGYSIGGSCAEIFASLFEYDIKLYLFGAPKGLSRRRQNELYSRVSVFRFKNRRDIVPWLPLRWRQSKKCVRIYPPSIGHAGYADQIAKLIEYLKGI